MPIPAGRVVISIYRTKFAGSKYEGEIPAIAFRMQLVDRLVYRNLCTAVRGIRGFNGYRPEPNEYVWRGI
jgi:hypothetical protein